MNIKELVFEQAKEEGFKIGVEEVKTEIVTNTLAVNQYTTAQIANFLKIPESFVKKVRAELNKIKKKNKDFELKQKAI
jgi:hypothetical protein